MRTNRQVAIFCTFQQDRRNFFILVKRNLRRGGFWQPFTGGEEDFDENDLLRTVERELEEETGIKISKDQIIDINHQFSFTDKLGIERFETSFGIKLTEGQKDNIRLSDEHTAMVCSDDITYLTSLLKFDENKKALEKFVKIIEGDNEF